MCEIIFECGFWQAVIDKILTFQKNCPKYDIFTKVVLFLTLLEFFLDWLLLSYKDYGRVSRENYFFFFFFTSCGSLKGVLYCFVLSNTFFVKRIRLCVATSCKVMLLRQCNTTPYTSLPLDILSPIKTTSPPGSHYTKLLSLTMNTLHLGVKREHLTPSNKFTCLIKSSTNLSNQCCLPATVVQCWKRIVRGSQLDAFCP